MDDKLLFRKKLAALFFLFKDKNYILADYFIKYEAITDDFLNRIVDSKLLDEALIKMENNVDMDKPYFTNKEEMEKYYNSILEKPISNPSYNKNEDNHQLLLEQLEEAVKQENYEKAAKIRDYMNKKGYK